MGDGAEACRGLEGCGKTLRVYLVCLVYLVSLVYSLSLVQPIRRDRPDRLDRPNRPHEQNKLTEFFSILLGLGLAVIKMSMLPVEPGMAKFVGKNIAPPGHG